VHDIIIGERGMLNMEDRIEEYFNKCWLAVELIAKGASDPEGLAWIAEDYLELLGKAIGVIQPK
jgi:hypothetical protein